MSLQRWIRQHPDFAEQFPNARAFLLLPAGERPRPAAEGREPPFPALLQQGENPGPFVGPVPGAFAGDAVEEQHANTQQAHDEDSEEESEEEDGALPILPIRIARGLMNMLWGGRGNADVAEPDSESEEERSTNDGGDHAVD